MAHPVTPAPVLLAFDTSTECLSVALVGAGVERLYNGPGGAQASADLLPVAEQLLAQAGLTWPQVDALAFGRGPGAFTGLRTACAVAQGLALGLAKPVIAIDSLLIVAEDALHDAAAGSSHDVAVLMDARMDQIYAVRYRWVAGVGPLPALALGRAAGHIAGDGADDDGAQGRADSTAHLWAPASWLAAWQGEAPDWLLGSGLALFEGEEAALPAGAVRGSGAGSGAGAGTGAGAGNGAAQGFAPTAAPGRCALPTHWAQARRVPAVGNRAAALLRLAQRAWARGETQDAAGALPRYVRDKVAQTTQERADSRAREAVAP